MNRIAFSRVAALIGLVLGLMSSILASAANAQAETKTPASQVQDIASPAILNNAHANSDQFGVTSACGWHDPYYTHCGGNLFVLVRVDFSWSWDEADIWVKRGEETNLESRFNRSIDFAWCVQNC